MLDMNSRLPHLGCLELTATCLCAGVDVLRCLPVGLWETYPDQKAF